MNNQLEIDRRNEQLGNAWALKFYAKPQAMSPDLWPWGTRLWFEQYLHRQRLEAKFWLGGRRRPAPVSQQRPESNIVQLVRR